MTEPQAGPFLFDTSAQSYLTATRIAQESQWLATYSILFAVHVSAVTVVERMRGYVAAEERADAGRLASLKQITDNYVDSLGSTKVLPLAVEEAVLAAQLMAMIPHPPSPPRRTHRGSESRYDRLSRWRFDIMIAATALVSNLPLIHNNPQDFEPLHAVIERMPERFPGVGPLNLISVKRLAA